MVHISFRFILITLIYWVDACIHKENHRNFSSCKKIGLEVNADQTKSMILSRDHNAGRSHSMKTDNISLKAWKI